MTAPSKNSVSVVIPAHNESEGIKDVVQSVSSVLTQADVAFEIIVVDDGSNDGMSEILATLNVRSTRHETKKGYGRSLADGIDLATNDTIAILDADATYPCEDLPLLLSHYEPGRMVVGWRKKLVMPGAKLPKSFARKFLHLLARLLTGEPIVDLNSGFRIFSKQFWKERRDQFPSGFSFTTTLTLLTHFAGGKISYVPIEYRSRKGFTKVHYLFDGLRVANWMIKLTWRNRPERLIFPLVLLLALTLRLLGICFGLPGQAYADEPHHINVALYFGSGDLNPHIFKYPTLWMYTLFGAYGLFFTLWSGFGLLRSVSDFTDLFIWNITPFYAIARILAALFGALAIVPLYRAARRLFDSEGAAITACLFFAVSPPLIAYSHQAKADMMMIFLSAAAWMFSIFYYKSGQLKHALGAGLSLGLACSTQYTAALLVPILLWAHLLKVGSEKFSIRNLFSKEIFLGYLMAPLAFLLTTPFSWLDSATFLRDLNDLRSYGQGHLAGDTVRLGFQSVFFYSEFTGIAIGGLTMLMLGLTAALTTKRKAGIFLLGPLAWGALALGLQSRQAGVVNYMFSIFPGVALALGGLWLLFTRFFKSPKQILTLLVLACLPGFIKAVRLDFDLMSKDTRLQAKDWIEANVPADSKILMDQPHESPPLYMNRTQVERLLEKTKAENHPRSAYYERMLRSHPGGGYEIFQIERTTDEMITLKRHGDWSRKAREWLEVEKGLPQARAADVQYIVWSSAGVTYDNSPRLKFFLDDLNQNGKLVKEFTPRPALFPLTSPLIKIYAVAEPQKPSNQ